MTGTLINIATILLGSISGLMFGARLPERLRETVIAGLGLFTSAIGVQMFLKIDNLIVVLGALLIGGVLGEWGRIETRLRNLGEILEQRFTKEGHRSDNEIPPKTQPDETPQDGSRFIRGFLTRSSRGATHRSDLIQARDRLTRSMFNPSLG